MATERERRRCLERLERLSDSSLDCDSLRREAVADLQRVVGFDRWCWPLADPQSLLPCSGLAEHDYVAGVPRTLDLEYSSDRFASKDLVARRKAAAGSLSVETDGDLARSSRWDQVMRHVGIGDVATVACRDALGCWGWIEAYRDRSDRRFDEDELALLASASPALGTGLRRSAYASVSTSPRATPRPPGVLVLDENLQPVSWTPEARTWMDSLPGAALLTRLKMLPSVIYPTAAVARRQPTADGAHALLRTETEEWVMIEAAQLEGQHDGPVAVTLRAATATEIFDLLCRAYAFSTRERDVVAAVVGGHSTREISARLCISPHTVQDHLKSVFGKIGVRSRRELLARLHG